MIHDVGGGLAFAKARYLNTPSHSFLSVDPLNYNLPQSYLLDPQQMNSYAYARNNPIIYNDPTGKVIEDFCLLECSLAVGYIAMNAPQIMSFAQSLSTPLGQMGIDYARSNYQQGNYKTALFGLATMGEGNAIKTEVTLLKNNTLVKNAAGELSNVFRGGSIEFKASDFKKTLVDGIINPALKSTPEGMSVNTVANVAKANSRSEIAIPILSLPKGLSLKQAGQNLNHYVIAPAYKMTVTKFESLLTNMADRIKKLNK